MPGLCQPVYLCHQELWLLVMLQPLLVHSCISTSVGWSCVPAPALSLLVLMTFQVLLWISGKELALLKPQIPAVKAGVGELCICSGVPRCVLLSKCCSCIEVDGGCLRPGQRQVGQQHLKNRGTAVLPSWLSISMSHVDHWQSLSPGHGTQMLVAHWELEFVNVEQQELPKQCWSS